MTTTKTSEEELTIREELATLREAKNKKSLLRHLQNVIDFCNISILVTENATRSLKIRTDEPISVGTED